jgi:hypothetical protein
MLTESIRNDLIKKAQDLQQRIETAVASNKFLVEELLKLNADDEDSPKARELKARVEHECKFADTLRAEFDSLIKQAYQSLNSGAVEEGPTNCGSPIAE